MKPYIIFDMDGTLISETQVGDGEYLKKAQIPEPPEHEGYRFDSWIGTNGVDIYNDEITQNTDVIAKYISNNGTVDGNYVVTFIDGVDGEQLGPTQYVAEGEAAVEPAYKYHEGYTFLRFSEDSSNVVNRRTLQCKQRRWRQRYDKRRNDEYERRRHEYQYEQ